MAETNRSTEALRERLTNLLADWGAEMSAVLTELDHAQARSEALETSAARQAEEGAARDGRLAELEERVQHQNELIETLKADAESAAGLRRAVQERDDELERLRTELAGREDLVQALRRDAEQVDRLRSDARRTERELEDLRGQNARLDSEAKRLEGVVAALEQSVHEESAEGSAEIEALRAELDARKSLIRSLRADADRARTLDRRLEEEREVIQQLEQTINRHADTMTDLRRTAELWKRRCRELKGDAGDASAIETATAAARSASEAGGATTTSLPAFADTDLAAVAEHLQKDGAAADRTVAIDMRRSLIEARRAAQTRD